MKHTSKKVRNYKKIAVTVSIVKKAPVTTVKPAFFLMWVYTMALYLFFILRGLIGIITIGAYNPRWLNTSVSYFTNKIIFYAGSSNVTISNQVRNKDTERGRNVRDI